MRHRLTATRSNLGDALRFGADDPNAWHSNGHVAARLGEFLLYDEYDPRRAILFKPDGKVWRLRRQPHRRAHLLRHRRPRAGFPAVLPELSSNEGQVINGCVETSPNGNTCLARADAWSDGDDVLFGDLGNDWLVGGTGKTRCGAAGATTSRTPTTSCRRAAAYDANGGKCGSPLNTWLNDAPDTHPIYEDRVFGGAGLDILIGNTGGDRLIDWIGEFNSYIVPFAPFGIATVSRQVPPALFEFLYALSKAQGADPTRAADNNIVSTAPRNGEPYGEIGLITQKDHGLWQDQSGQPDRPAGREHPRRQARRPPHGELQRRNARPASRPTAAPGRSPAPLCNVSAASLGKDAAAVFYVDQTLPVYYEIFAQVLVQKPTAGWKANAYVIFDYFSPTDFKFAGLDVALNKVVARPPHGAGLGHRRSRPSLPAGVARRHATTASRSSSTDSS